MALHLNVDLIPDAVEGPVMTVVAVLVTAIVVAERVPLHHPLDSPGRSSP